MLLPEVKIYSRMEIGSHTYEEEDLHKPFLTRTASRAASGESFAKAANLLYSLTNVQPRKGREFEEMELNISWDEFCGAKLFAIPKALVIKFPALNQAGSYTFIYGWIDDAQPIATKGPEVNTRIRWHVDWWLTWSDYNWFMLQGQLQILANWFPRRVTLGSGRLLKGPETFARPSGTAPRKWEVKSALSMISDKIDPTADLATWWAVMACTETSGTPPEEVVTDIVYFYWPIGERISGASHNSPNWTSIYTGQLEEELGIDPSRIQGFWVAPIRPWTSGTIVNKTAVSVYQADQLNAYNSNTLVLDDPIKTTDAQKIIFTDPSGTEMNTAPWGLEIKSIVTWLDIGTNAAYLCVYLGETSTPISEHKAAEGRYFTFPLPILPVTENAWSSYNYSGQREYDMEQRSIQRDQSAVNGISGIGTQAIGGAIAGAAVGNLPGAVAGGIGGLASGLIGTAVNYYTAEDFDRRSQRSVDLLTSRQTAAMILSAGSYTGLKPLYGGYFGWTVVIMERDGVSLAELAAEQSELGYDTNTWVNDCTSLIEAGGPLKIENLLVKGDIPKEGKEYIRAMFARGVNLDLIS